MNLALRHDFVIELPLIPMPAKLIKSSIRYGESTR